MAIFRAKSTLLKEEHGQMARAKRHFLPGHVWHISYPFHLKAVLGNTSFPMLGLCQSFCNTQPNDGLTTQ